MPEAAPLLIPVLRGALTWLVQNTIAGSIGAVRDAVLQLGQAIDWLTGITQDVFGAAKGGENYSERWATQAGEGIAKLGDDLKAITEHTYDTVIPRSLSWLDGYIVAHQIDPLRLRIAQEQHQIDFLMGWRSQIDTWRHKFVDPHIEQWIGWRKWFDGWPQGVLYRWHDWFQHPAGFGQWAAPPVAGPLVAYIADRQHERLRDDLALILVKSWATEPDRIWTAVEEWLVS